MNVPSRPPVTGTRIAAGATAAWLIFLAVDFVLHAGIFAGWWRATGSYWMPPADLFRLIPFAYVAFAIHCLVMTWLLVRIQGDDRTIISAGRFGAAAGLILGAVIALSNYSVLRLPVLSLLVWPASFMIESAFACAAASWVLDAQRPWRRVAIVFGAALVLMIIGIVLQNLIYPEHG